MMTPELQELIGEAFEKTADYIDALEQRCSTLAEAVGQEKSASEQEEVTRLATKISAHMGVPVDDELKTKVATIPSDFRQLLNDFSEKSASGDIGSTADRNDADAEKGDNAWDAFGNWILS